MFPDLAGSVWVGDFHIFGVSGIGYHELVPDPAPGVTKRFGALLAPSHDKLVHLTIQKNYI
jgi:hypothetical protein